MLGSDHLERAAMCTNCEVVSAAAGALGETPAASPVGRAGAPDGPGGVTVLRGGAVYTLDPHRPWAQAIAVRGRDIIAVGSDDEVAKSRPRTRLFLPSRTTRGRTRAVRSADSVGG